MFYINLYDIFKSYHPYHTIYLFITTFIIYSLNQYK